MKHLLYEDRQWNYWFLHNEQLEEIKKTPSYYFEIMQNMHRVLLAKIESIDWIDMIKLLKDTNYVKETMDKWIPVKEEQKDYHPCGL